MIPKLIITVKNYAMKSLTHNNNENTRQTHPNTLYFIATFRFIRLSSACGFESSRESVPTQSLSQGSFTLLFAIQVSSKSRLTSVSSSRYVLGRRSRPPETCFPHYRPEKRASLTCFITALHSPHVSPNHRSFHTPHGAVTAGALVASCSCIS